MIKKFIKLTKKKVFWGILGFITFISITVYLLYFTNFFILKKIIISENKKVSTKEIIELTGLKGGERLFRIPIQEIRKKILTNSYIEEVTIIRHLPDTLEIRVKERSPLAIVVKNNKGYLIDKNGVIIDSISPEDYQFYPLIEIKNPEFKEKFLKFLFWIKENENYLPVYEAFSKIILNEDKLIFITKNKMKIYFPLISEKDWTYFYKILDRIITYLYEKKLAEKVELIRLDYPFGKALIKFKS